MADSYPKTVFIDIDGTIVPNLSIEDLEKYNQIPNCIGELVPGVKDFFENIHCNDRMVIFTTARKSIYKEFTERTLHHHKIKYHRLLMNVPAGQTFFSSSSLMVLL